MYLSHKAKEVGEKGKKSHEKLGGHVPFIPKLHGNLNLKNEDKGDSSASILELHERVTGKVCASPLGCHGCLETLPADSQTLEFVVAA